MVLYWHNTSTALIYIIFTGIEPVALLVITWHVTGDPGCSGSVVTWWVTPSLPCSSSSMSRLVRVGYCRRHLGVRSLTHVTWYVTWYVMCRGPWWSQRVVLDHIGLTDLLSIWVIGDSCSTYRLYSAPIECTQAAHVAQLCYLVTVMVSNPRFDILRDLFLRVPHCDV